jgi:hypothetical protein
MRLKSDESETNISPNETKDFVTPKPLAPSGPAATLDLATAVVAQAAPFQGVGRQNLSQRFRMPDLKSLKTLGALNQRFRSFICFQ